MTNTTLKKIAETLGISISTVSRALKKHPDISEQTRKKVTELAETLDYEPNANAVHLRTRNSRLLGILVPTVANHFYESFISSLVEEGRKQGYSVMILQSGNRPDVELENLKLFRQNRVSGLFAAITAHTEDLSGFDKFAELETPVVFIDIVPARAGLHTVCMADEQAARLAAEYILRKKRKKVLALFGEAQLSITRKRLGAFTQSLSQKKNNTVLLTESAASSEMARQLTHAALRQSDRPDTIFCMSDEILIGVMKSLQEHHIRIPEQMAVIAISNGFIPKLFHPEITYVETSGEKLGRLAFAQMMNCVQKLEQNPESILEAVLVKGGSC
jgi:LacI family transcriptional regulator